MGDLLDGLVGDVGGLWNDVSDSATTFLSSSGASTIANLWTSTENAKTNAKTESEKAAASAANTKLLIYGGIGLAAVVIVAMYMRK
jgi:hypothetical protein